MFNASDFSLIQKTKWILLMAMFLANVVCAVTFETVIPIDIKAKLKINNSTSLHFVIDDDYALKLLGNNKYLEISAIDAARITGTGAKFTEKAFLLRGYRADKNSPARAWVLDNSIYILHNSPSKHGMLTTQEFRAVVFLNEPIRDVTAEAFTELWENRPHAAPSTVTTIKIEPKIDKDLNKK